MAQDCSLFGQHLLEASAGTGKTFSIEHVYVRLVLEGVDIEQILVVTFTRAATRELKARIRQNLEKALLCIQEKNVLWGYLEAYIDSEQAVHRLNDAISLFERSQIFTIHGFYSRILKELAFEANVLSVSNPEEERKIPEKLRFAVSDFLSDGIDEKLLCPEQAALLLNEFESMETVAEKLLRLEPVEPVDSFEHLLAKCKAALQAWKGEPIEEEKLLTDFRALEKNYKALPKGNFELQVKALAEPALFPMLLKEKGALFNFLSPDNRKVRAQEPLHLHYPGFFDWARVHIGPLCQQKVFPVLQSAWNRIAQKVLDDDEYFNPDQIVLCMKKAATNPQFAELIRQKYKAAIVDEFQDTDALQWDIFKALFTNPPLKAVYLVGDPKQSIYRFRKADVYTYLKARDWVGEGGLYQLDTNFRSSKQLIGALNALFSREWLDLPKAGTALPYCPVRAGARIESDFPDEKGAVHVFVAQGDPSSLFETAFLPAAVREIERLQLKQCALLVKDRYQAETALGFLKQRGIPAIAKSHTPIGKTDAFRAISELFDAVMSPHDKNAAQIAREGLFSPKTDLSFAEYKVLLEEKGLVPFAKQFELDADGRQIFELLFGWEKREGFSFDGLKRYLHHLKHLDPEEGGRRRVEINEEAVQIMTLHVSKGLEFEVVFALGLASRTPQGEEIAESDAEKKRQLYVAMTRAKKRLYIPVALSETQPAPGTGSPMELFSAHFQGPFLEELRRLSEIESITMEMVSSPVVLGPPIVSTRPEVLPERIAVRPFSPCYLSSFTTLARPRTSEIGWTESDPSQFNLQSLPRGSETGIAIHALFEKIFSSPERVWRDPPALDALVADSLRTSPLLPWKQSIQEMVAKTIGLPLETDGEFFSLRDIDRCQVEMEFLFSSPPHFVKGFIDLVFYHRNQVYLIDWKTNWLEEYSLSFLEKAMDAHDYGLQASLYAEAIRRHFQCPFGGAYYIFVRGGAYTKRYP